MKAIIGRISSIDSSGMVSVAYGTSEGMATDYMPFLTFNDEYKPPTVGQVVLAIEVSASRSVCLGSMWNTANTVPSGCDYKKTFADGSYLQINGRECTLFSKEIYLENEAYKISLTRLLQRIEAIDGDMSARKEV